MLETLRKVCSIDSEKFYIDMKDSANTVSSTIPIALSKIQEGNFLPLNSTVLIAGFGVGYSWGACVLKY
jgi:3-oxoacyl-[acyl-carrier-protein] synthase-3